MIASAEATEAARAEAAADLAAGVVPAADLAAAAAREADFLRASSAELTALKPEPGEETTLSEKRQGIESPCLAFLVNSDILDLGVDVEIGIAGPAAGVLEHGDNEAHGNALATGLAGSGEGEGLLNEAERGGRCVPIQFL